jgi:hypothetical protein
VLSALVRRPITLLIATLVSVPFLVAGGGWAGSGPDPDPAGPDVADGIDRQDGV